MLIDGLVEGLASMKEMRRKKRKKRGAFMYDLRREKEKGKTYFD